MHRLPTIAHTLLIALLVAAGTLRLCPCGPADTTLSASPADRSTAGTDSCCPLTGAAASHETPPKDHSPEAPDDDCTHCQRLTLAQPGDNGHAVATLTDGPGRDLPPALHAPLAWGPQPLPAVRVAPRTRFTQPVLRSAATLRARRTLALI